MKYSSAFVIIMIIGIGLTGLIYFPQAQSQQDRASDFSRLTFNVESTKRQFILAEPIPFILSVKNETGQQIEGNIDLGFMSGQVKVFVEKPDKKIVKIDPLSKYRGCSVCVPQPVTPNAQYKSREIIDFNVEKFFDRPGEYKIWAELCNKMCNNLPTSKATSNLLILSIFQPQGVDHETYLDYKKLREFERTKWNKNTFGQYMQILQEFSDKHSNSPFSDYIRNDLGNLYNGFGQHQKAKETYLRISPNYIFKDKVDKGLKKIDEKMKQPNRPQ
jgi:hypothetical protein